MTNDEILMEAIGKHTLLEMIYVYPMQLEMKS